jgi:hypothetical protein
MSSIDARGRGTLQYMNERRVDNVGGKTGGYMALTTT